MQRFKRLFRNLSTACFGYVLTVSIALAGATVSINRDDNYGFVYANERGFAEQQSLLVTASGSDEVFSFAVASRVGGVILQAVAEPEPPSAKVNISYDPSSQDGHRFKISIGDETVEISAPDWEMIPLIRFVHSKQTAAMTLLGEPKNEIERLSYSVAGAMFIEIHPALRDTVLGNNFIFTDAMLVGGEPGSIRHVTESFSAPIPGYSDVANFDGKKSAQAARRVKDQLGKGGWDSYIFTDVNVKFSFSISKHLLKMTGDPYYAFVRLDVEKQTCELNNKLTEAFKKSGIVGDLNPKIYGLDRAAFQLAALLRNFKATDNENWNALFKAVSAESPEPAMVTPRAWIP